MIIVESYNKIPIRLTIERWNHIVQRHPETRNFQQEVLQTVNKPDLIQKGDFGELIAIRDYSNLLRVARYIAVVYKEISKEDGFIITAYITNQPLKRREIIWKR